MWTFSFEVSASVPLSVPDSYGGEVSGVVLASRPKRPSVGLLFWSSAPEFNLKGNFVFVEGPLDRNEGSLSFVPPFCV